MLGVAERFLALALDPSYVERGHVDSGRKLLGSFLVACPARQQRDQFWCFDQEVETPGLVAPCRAERAAVDRTARRKTRDGSGTGDGDLASRIGEPGDTSLKQRLAMLGDNAILIEHGLAKARDLHGRQRCANRVISLLRLLDPLLTLLGPSIEL